MLYNKEKRQSLPKNLKPECQLIFMFLKINKSNINQIDIPQMTFIHCVVFLLFC